MSIDHVWIDDGVDKDGDPTGHWEKKPNVQEDGGDEVERVGVGTERKREREETMGNGMGSESVPLVKEIINSHV
jgi:hypothetical protein